MKPVPRKRIDIFIVLDPAIGQMQAYVADGKQDEQLRPYKQCKYYPTRGQIDLYLHYKASDEITPMALDMMAYTIAKNHKWRLRDIQVSE